MNPYVEPYFVVKAVEKDGKYDISDKQTKYQLSEKGRFVRSRLARVARAAAPTERAIMALGVLCGLMLDGVVIWLQATNHPWMVELYETANRDWPWYMGIFLSDLFPMVWVGFLGCCIGCTIGSFMLFRPVWKIGRVRSRIFVAHPLYSEGVEMCKE